MPTIIIPTVSESNRQFMVRLEWREHGIHYHVQARDLLEALETLLYELSNWDVTNLELQEYRNIVRITLFDVTPTEKEKKFLEEQEKKENDQ